MKMQDMKFHDLKMHDIKIQEHDWLPAAGARPR